MRPDDLDAFILRPDFKMEKEMYRRVKRKLDSPVEPPFDKEEALALIDEIMKRKTDADLRLALCKYVLDVYFKGDFFPDNETKR